MVDNNKEDENVYNDYLEKEVNSQFEMMWNLFVSQSMPSVMPVTDGNIMTAIKAGESAFIYSLRMSFDLNTNNITNVEVGLDGNISFTVVKSIVVALQGGGNGTKSANGSLDGQGSEAMVATDVATDSDSYNVMTITSDYVMSAEGKILSVSSEVEVVSGLINSDFFWDTNNSMITDAYGRPIYVATGATTTTTEYNIEVAYDEDVAETDAYVFYQSMLDNLDTLRESAVENNPGSN